MNPSSSSETATPTGPANAAGPSERCFARARSFVNVRPFTGVESTLIAPEQCVVRPALLYDTGIVNNIGNASYNNYDPEKNECSGGVLVVLDSTQRFKPKKGGEYQFMYDVNEHIILAPDGSIMNPAIPLGFSLQSGPSTMPTPKTGGKSGRFNSVTGRSSSVYNDPNSAAPSAPAAPPPRAGAAPAPSAGCPVIWCFYDNEEPDPPAPAATAADVYRRVVVPVLPAIVEGYGAAFLCYGAAGTGKWTTLFGEEGAPWHAPEDSSKADSANDEALPSRQPRTGRGLFPRFADDIYRLLNAQTRSNSSFTVELEAIEVNDSANVSSGSSGSGTAGVSIAGPSNSAPAVSAYFDLQGSKNQKGLELKVRDDPTEGPVLQGATRTLCEDAKSLQDAALSAVRRYQRRAERASQGSANGGRSMSINPALSSRASIAGSGPNSEPGSLFLSVRIVETYRFKDPANPSAPEVLKSRRVVVHFGLLRSLSSSGARLFDVAIERDTGSNAHAKVPLRESPLGRLYADIFTQALNVTIISCVSPCFRDTRETHATIAWASRVRAIRTAPRLNHDTAMLELRRLADEMSSLDRSVLQTNESMKIVQEELDRRQREVEQRQRQLQELRDRLRDARGVVNGYEAFRDREEARMQAALADQASAELEEQQRSIDLMAAMERTRRQTAGILDEQTALRAKLTAASKEQEELEAKLEEQERKFSRHKEEQRRVAEMQEFIDADPSERGQAATRLASEALELRRTILPNARTARDDSAAETKRKQAEVDEATSRLDGWRAKEAEIVTSEASIETKKRVITDLEREARELEAEIMRLEEENLKAKKGCLCC